MERSRSKRNYYYDHHHPGGDYDGGGGGGGDTMMGARTKPRYNNNNNNSSHFGVNLNRHHHHYNHHNHRGGGGGGGGGGIGNANPNLNPNSMNNNSNRPLSSKPQQQLQQQPQQLQQQDSGSLMVTTSYRILCHDMKAGGVIGKSGSIIKSIRQHTGAWINVHELIPGDEERIIEISDTRRRDPEGRMPAFSPAQEALFLIHERMLESGQGFYHDDESIGGGGGGGPGGGGANNRVATRLVVNRMHVGCLLGKGGKIIEQMRIETKTQIRILPRDHTLPHCVSMSEEIVQVFLLALLPLFDCL